MPGWPTRPLIGSDANAKTIKDWLTLVWQTFKSMMSVESTSASRLANPKNDYLIKVDATGGNRTITLPTAIGNVGKSFIVKKMDASGNQVIVATSASQTIDGAASKNTTTQYAVIRVISDDSNWLTW
jgi:hypothetical protein